MSIGLTHHQLVDTARDRGVRRLYALVMPEHERREGNDKYVEVEL